MKKNIFLEIAAMVIVVFAALMIANINSSFAQAQLRQSVERKYEEYRKAIKDAYQVDIKSFKDKLPGGMADGKPITNYDIGQLLEGIKMERDHTKDNMLALELAMDHLEHIPDYYTHLTRMEQQCASEKLLSQ
jgi:hypothetical protein